MVLHDKNTCKDADTLTDGRPQDRSQGSPGKRFHEKNQA